MIENFSDIKPGMLIWRKSSQAPEFSCFFLVVTVKGPIYREIEENGIMLVVFPFAKSGKYVPGTDRETTSFFFNLAEIRRELTIIKSGATS